MTTVPTSSQTPTAPAVLAQIRSALPSLRPSDAKVARVVLDAPDAAMSLTVAEVAAAAEVSDATVIHFCKELGFSGFQHLKFALARDHVPVSSLLHEQQRLETSSGTADVIADVLQSTVRALDDVPGTLDLEHFDAVVGAILRARRICVIGALPSLMLAEDAAYRLSTIGRPAEAPATDTAQRIACTLLEPGDLCLVISHTGATKQSFAALDAAVSAGATTAAITSFARSRLASSVDHALIAGAAAVSVRVEAMASRFAHLAVIDALYVAVVTRDEESALRARRVADAIHAEYQL
ncbi:MAG TPA: MurR/RpiR family transcriptional regulator [Conexibacter sp.]|jgi:RpiR family carbohydrate utilization transcriptional regulator|nr:MurR/RpiR family transcriptional regulator [Conexibacter sp.]